MRNAVLIALVATLVLSGCTSGDEQAAAGDRGDRGDRDQTTADGSAGDSDTITATDLRSSFEQPLSHHAVLVAEAMRAAADDTTAKDEALARLRRNTQRLTDAFAAAFGDEPAAEFAELWADNVDALLDYAESGGGAEGEKSLAEVRDVYAAFIATTTDGALDEDAARGQLEQHHAHLTELADAAEQGKDDRAFEAQREAFAHMFTVGQELAAAAAQQFPDRVEGDLGASGVELDSALRQLFTEHTSLLVDAVRRLSRGEDAAGDAAAALNGNTEDLTAALLSIYDEDTAVDFDDLWRSYIGDVADYTVAAVEGPRNKRRRAERELEDFAPAFGTFLAATTENEIAAATARPAVEAHVDLLLRHSDAVARKRPRRAAALADQAFEASAELAQLIAGGVAAHRPDEFPPQG